jgi:hypothetical protein
VPRKLSPVDAGGARDGQETGSRRTIMTHLLAAWRRLNCAFNRHDYELLGTHYKDEILRCKTCGQRHTKVYTLRINRLG